MLPDLNKLREGEITKPTEGTTPRPLPLSGLPKLGPTTLGPNLSATKPPPQGESVSVDLDDSAEEELIDLEDDFEFDPGETLPSEGDFEGITPIREDEDLTEEGVVFQDDSLEASADPSDSTVLTLSGIIVEGKITRGMTVVRLETDDGPAIVSVPFEEPSLASGRATFEASFLKYTSAGTPVYDFESLVSVETGYSEEAPPPVKKEGVEESTKPTKGKEGKLIDSIRGALAQVKEELKRGRETTEGNEEEEEVPEREKGEPSRLKSLLILILIIVLSWILIPKVLPLLGGDANQSRLSSRESKVKNDISSFSISSPVLEDEVLTFTTRNDSDFYDSISFKVNLRGKGKTSTSCRGPVVVVAPGEVLEYSFVCPSGVLTHPKIESIDIINEN